MAQTTRSLLRSVTFVFGLSAALSLASAACARKSDPGGSAGAPVEKKTVTLLNVSYDPTRELYEAENTAFAARFKAKHPGQDIKIEQSHGGSGKQARAVLDGLEADVVTLALAYDVDVLAEKGKLLGADWQTRLPQNSAPYTSTVVFVVRKGNAKKIRDWDDLVRDGVSVITPNPKTSGGARWNYLAAWGYAYKKAGNSEKAARDYMTKLFHNVPVLDSGARGATTSFSERGLGDVLLAWENEAQLLISGPNKDKFEVIVPSVSIVAEPPVAVVDKYADKHGTRAAAQEYLEFLFTDEGQEIAAKNHYRASSKTVAAIHASEFPNLERFTIKDVFGTWAAAQHAHFDDGGIFDQLTTPAR